MNYAGRMHARSLLRLGHPEYCHCHRCWQPSRFWRVVRFVAPWAATAACLFIIGHIIVRIATLFPNATRIGQ